MQPSKYQEAVLEESKNPETNILVSALAGTGKTTLIKMIDAQLGGRNLYLVFNRRNADEAKEKLKCEVSTFNSFGNSLVPRKAKLNKYKAYNILEQIHDSKTATKFGARVSRLVSLFRSHCCRVDIPTLCDKYDIEVDDKLLSITYSVMREWYDDRTINFDDQLWYPVYYDVTFPTYDTVYVDECQDLNPVKIEIVKRLHDRGARIIAVGDAKQAIYGFAGADTEALETLSKIISFKTLPLNLNYRCSRAVIREAQKIVPEIEYHDGAAEGQVKKVEEINPKEGDFVLCRTTLPLIKECTRLLKRGIKATVLGKEIADGLKNIVKNLKTSLDEWFVKEKARLISRKRRTDLLEDQYETLSYLMEDGSSNEEVISKLDKLFDDKIAGVTLMTAHKSKGLEAENVWIISRSLFPHPKATDLTQEQNLEYVAVTRAKHNLYWSE